MSDNQSWNHAGIYREAVVKTSNLDKVAFTGVRFTNAFCNTPSCIPARASLLTVQHTWQLEEGLNLCIILYKIYTNIIKEAGYTVSYQGKGWGPGSFTANGWPRTPAGNEFESFETFLKEKRQDQPWTFWVSSKEPHRPYKVGPGKAAGIDLNKIRVPGYLPDTEDTRIDISDYYATIQQFDSEIGNLLNTLSKSGEADHTVIIICSNNGWQMPRGLANLYDFGTRIPLIISWPGKFKENNIKPHQLWKGANIKNLIENNSYNHRDTLVIQTAFANNEKLLGVNGKSVITTRYKYIVYDKGKNREQLFDLENDPGETKNLAVQSDHKKLLNSMRSYLVQWAHENANKFFDYSFL